MSKNLFCGTAIVISPHPDDMEIGCGATVSKMVLGGSSVTNIIVTLARNYGSGIVLDIDQRMEEIENSELCLGTKTLYLDFPHRNIELERQKLLQNLCDIRELIDPDIVFIPSLNDIHQDHKTVSLEAMRAFKGTTLLGYEELWNNRQFKTHVFSVVDNNQLMRKIESILCYKTQSGRYYMNEDVIRSLARARGAQIGATFAEAFEVIQCVWK